MADERAMTAEEVELTAAIRRVLESESRKKLIVAGPGTGKTTLFKQMLEMAPGDPNERLVLTFINNLKDDLEKDLAGLADVSTLHSHCLGLMYAQAEFRQSLSEGFRCQPGLASLIKEDWEYIEGSEAPLFVQEMRNLSDDEHLEFYLKRGEFYDAVDFDDSVYRVYMSLKSGIASLRGYDLVLVDEYQDFNRLEAAFIDFLAQTSPIMIVGDDDQALYSQLRDSSWDYIRSMYGDGEYEVFELPFCMRCPEVVVGAVADVIGRARELAKLKGRIDKPYRHFPPVKGEDSERYPTIALVRTSVQRLPANYMGMFIGQAIDAIPQEEVEAAREGGYPPALVIVPNPYRDQIVHHLEEAGYSVDARKAPDTGLDRDLGLAILKEDPDSNLGWRIILKSESRQTAVAAVAPTADRARRLLEFLPDELRERTLEEANSWNPPPDDWEAEPHASEANEASSVRVTSFEGAKGLSAQHVFIAGLHVGDLPKKQGAIQDLEICRFVVGLTRTRKKCYLVFTQNFAGKWMTPSPFIGWIDSARLERLEIDAAYWKQHE
jgi:superfamily I DNA/RNA helicase